MTRSAIVLDRLEFYITNVCNLTCSECNRYNNYHFRGWSAWEDHADNLAQWARRIKIRHPVILGGEPLLNRDIVKWVRGLRRLWPYSEGIQIQSNGTRIDLVPGLYEALTNKKRNWIGVSIHDVDDQQQIFSKIRNFLRAPIMETADKNDPAGSDYQFRDVNQQTVHVWISNKFVNSNVIQTDHGRFTLYNSDPVKAHDNCNFRKFKNYHWVNGAIYKCGPVALMPQFDDQHDFDISPNDKMLLREYRALHVDEFDRRSQHFFDHIDDVIPQCKFCPESYDSRVITFSDRKKSWKISQLGSDILA